MRPLPDFHYAEPASIGDAVALLAEAGERGMIIGGGTDLVPSLRQGLFAPRVVISLQAVDGLADIAWDDAIGLRLGPSATLRAVESHGEILRRFPILAQAAHEVASPQLRQMATIGGNLCLDTRCYHYNQYEEWRACHDACLKVGGEFCKAVPRARKCFAAFSADVAPALIALGARITLASPRGERTIALADFYSGDGAKPLAKAADEIITGVLVPKDKSGYQGAYLKYRVRQAIDYPLASVALTLRLEDGVVADPVLVVSGVAPRPLPVKGLAALLDGQRLTAELVERAAGLARKAAMPVANTGGDHHHRKVMIYELARQAFGVVAP